MKNLLKVSVRQQALFIPESTQSNEGFYLKDSTSVLIANLAKLGFGVTEELKNTLNLVNADEQEQLLEIFREVTGVKKNWTPLVKGWDTPTGETAMDHLVTFFTNVFKGKGTKLQCGHIIPPDTFPLERYNGCPFCGTPFEFGELKNYGQGSKLKILELWTKPDAEKLLKDLLSSKTALDATQMDSLNLLLQELPLPEVEVGMKETLMQVIDILIQEDKADQAQALFSSPADIMRYLWFKHTGFLQIIEPKTIRNRKSKNQGHIFRPLDQSAQAQIHYRTTLKLKYSRKECLMVAKWLNNLKMPVEKLAEVMHPKRNMWVRFIRALRLAECSHRKDFEKLKVLLDVFYNENYEVWQGRVNHFRLRADAEKHWNC